MIVADVCHVQYTNYFKKKKRTYTLKKVACTFNEIVYTTIRVTQLNVGSRTWDQYLARISSPIVFLMVLAGQMVTAGKCNLYSG